SPPRRIESAPLPRELHQEGSVQGADGAHPRSRHHGAGRARRRRHQWTGTPEKRGHTMKATRLLHDAGQSLWLDNISRELLESGTLQRYIDELSVTGLTSNPTIYDHSIKNGATYDSAIAAKLRRGKSGEELFFELALEDLTRTADLFRPIHEKTNGVDGWVSLEVSPLLAYDATRTLV